MFDLELKAVGAILSVIYSYPLLLTPGVLRSSVSVAASTLHAALILTLGRNR